MNFNAQPHTVTIVCAGDAALTIAAKIAMAIKQYTV